MSTVEITYKDGHTEVYETHIRTDLLVEHARKAGTVRKLEVHQVDTWPTPDECPTY